jgi:hypothetical protein
MNYFLLYYNYMQWYYDNMDKAAFLIEALCTDVQRDVTRRCYLPITLHAVEIWS